MTGGTIRTILLWALALIVVICASLKVGVFISFGPDVITKESNTSLSDANTPNTYLDTADEWFNITSFRRRALKKRKKVTPATNTAAEALQESAKTLLASEVTTDATTPVPVVTPLPTNPPAPAPTQDGRKKKNKRNRATPAPVAETGAPTHEISKFQKKQKKRGKELTAWQKKQLAKQMGNGKKEDSASFVVTKAPKNKKNAPVFTPRPTLSPTQAPKMNIRNKKNSTPQAQTADIETTDAATTEKPLLVLHIGPQKTATTTLQCELNWFKELLREQGNFVFLGRSIHEDCNHGNYHSGYKLNTNKLFVCLNTHSEKFPCDEQPVFKEFQKTLARMANNNLNVIVSEESFSRLKLQNGNLGLLIDAIGKHYRIRMPLVYQHYFASLVGHYQARQRPYGRKRAMDRWPGGRGDKSQPAPPFPEWYSQYTAHLWEAEEEPQEVSGSDGNYVLASSALDLHPVMYLQKRWSDPSVSEFAPKADDFVVLDMHDAETSQDIMVDFVRKVLSPELAVAVETLKKQQAEEGNPVPTKKESSTNYDLDLLATKAHDQGLIPNDKGVTRRTVFEYIQEAFPQETDIAAADVPYNCMDKDKLQEFRLRSLALEETVFGDKFKGKRGKSRKTQHRAGFDEYVADHKFCNLDTEQLLANESVQNLFGSIGSRISSQK